MGGSKRRIVTEGDGKEEKKGQKEGRGFEEGMGVVGLPRGL